MKFEEIKKLAEKSEKLSPDEMKKLAGGIKENPKAREIAMKGAINSGDYDTLAYLLLKR